MDGGTGPLGLDMHSPYSPSSFWRIAFSSAQADWRHKHLAQGLFMLYGQDPGMGRFAKKSFCRPVKGVVDRRLICMRSRQSVKHPIDKKEQKFGTNLYFFCVMCYNERPYCWIVLSVSLLLFCADAFQKYSFSKGRLRNVTCICVIVL